MKKQLLFILLLALGFGSFGQNFQWATRIGGESMDIGQSIIIDDSGYIYTMGTFNDGNSGSFTGNVDFDPGPDVYYLTGKGSFITKTTPAGKFIWAQSVPGGISSIKIDPKGNVFVTGQFVGKPDFDSGKDTCILNSEGETDVFILKLNMYGKFVFAKRIGGKYSERSYLMELDKSGNIYTTGYCNGLVDFDPGTATYKLNSTGYFKLKLDSSGSFLSVEIIKFNPNPLVKDASGNTYETGCFNYIQDFDRDASKTYNLKAIGEYDAYILKMDSLGKFIWAIGLGGKLDDCGVSLKVDANQNVYLTGYFEDSIDLDPGKGTYYLGAVGKKDVFIAKYDSKGNFLWGKSVGGIDNESSTLLLLDDSTNVYTTGYFEDNITIDTGKGKLKLVSAGNKDIFIIKLNKSGKILWAKKIGGTDYEEIRTMIIDKDQNLYATGHFVETVDFDPDEAKFIEKAKGSYWPDAFVLKLGPCPSPTEAITGSAVLCGTVNQGTYSITQSAGANGYLWTVPKGATIDSGQNTAKIKVTFGSTLGEITVRPSNICDTTIKSILTIKNFPAANVIARAYPSTKLCKGNYVSLNGEGANTYTWNKGVINYKYFFPDSTNTYIVTGTDNNGCIGSDTITIIVEVKSPATINGSTKLCPGKKASYSITPISGANGYSWTVPNDAKIDSGQNSTSIYVTFGNTSGDVSVIPTNACTTIPTNLYVTVIRDIGIKVTPSSAICKGTSITLSGTGSSNYIWSGGITNGVPFKPDTTTIYTVTIPGSTVCSDTNSILIKVTPIPVVGAKASLSMVCYGGLVTFNGTGASNYVWSGSVINGSPHKLVSSGKYTVRGDINGCSDTSSIYITVKPSLISLQPKTTNIISDSSGKLMTRSFSINATFQWQTDKNNNNTFVNLTNDEIFKGVTNDTLLIIKPPYSLNGSKYRCLVTDDNCTENSDVILFKIIKLISIENLSKFQNTFSIFPNPSTNLITIESSHNLNNEPFTIIDHTGMQILTGVLNKKTNAVDISTLATGFYFIQIGEEKKETFKIVKQ